MTTYVVGDIQACFIGLQKLLNKVNFCSKTDHLIAVGDLIGRGQQAQETLDYLMALGDSFTTVLGNHDLHFLAIFADIRKAKPSDNFATLLSSPKIERYTNWLRQQPLALSPNKDTLISHAGLYPLWSIKDALKYSDEINEQLNGDDWQDFLRNMYGSQPDKWNQNLQGYERRRFIVNAFTRMRFIQNNDTLNFKCKSAPQDSPKNLKPWFAIPNPQLKQQQLILFGHWAALQGNTQLTNIIGLDTGYLWGQSMTLLNLDSMDKISISNQETQSTADTR